MEIPVESVIEIVDESVMIMDSPNIETAQNIFKWCKDDLLYSHTGKGGPWQSVQEMINKSLAENIMKNKEN